MDGMVLVDIEDDRVADMIAAVLASGCVAIE